MGTLYTYSSDGASPTGTNFSVIESFEGFSGDLTGSITTDLDFNDRQDPLGPASSLLHEGNQYMTCQLDSEGATTALLVDVDKRYPSPAPYRIDYVIRFVDPTFSGGVMEEVVFESWSQGDPGNSNSKRIKGLAWNSSIDKLAVAYGSNVIKFYEPTSWAVVSEMSVPSIPIPYNDIQDLAYDSALDKYVMVLGRYAEKYIVVVNPIDWSVETYFPCSELAIPFSSWTDKNQIEYYIEVDTSGNLLACASTYYDYWPKNVVSKYSGITSTLIDMIVVGQVIEDDPYSNQCENCPGVGRLAWSGVADPPYDPITGNPEVDGILQVIDGVWENPNGPNTPGAYKAEVVKIAKMLGYRGKDLADIVKAASQSDVNK